MISRNIRCVIVRSIRVVYCLLVYMSVVVELYVQLP